MLNKTNILKMFKNQKRNDLEAGTPSSTSVTPYHNEIILMKQNLAQIKSLINAIYDRPVQILDKKIEQQKYQTTSQITHLLKQTKTSISNLSKYKEREVINIQSRLFVELSHLSNEFQTIQRKSLENIQHALPDEPYFGMTDNQYQQISLLDDDITTRKKEIKQVATSITELSELMKDIAHLVHFQGELVDHIEYNVESAEKDIKQGTQEIKKAEESQKRGRKFYCILFLLLLLIVGLMIMLIKMLI